MKKMLAMALVLMLTLTAAACAETFKMGFDAEYPPYTYMGDDGEYTGFDIEMCKKVCEKLGWELELVPINWDTKLMTLDMGEIDCIWSGLTIDVIDPEAYCLSTPYSDNSQMILTRADSGITTLSDLAGKKVAVQLGTSADLLLQGDQKALADTFDGGEAVKLPNYNDCFAQLEAGAVDAIAITGGMAHSQRLTGWIRERVEFLAPVFLKPGELELEALALGGLRVMRGQEEAHEFIAAPVS